MEDLLYWFPRDYEDRQRLYTVASAPAGEKCCVAAEITEPPRTSRTRTGMEMTRFRAADDTGFLTLTFFHQSYVRSALRPGQRYLFYGPVEGAGPRKTMVNPLFDREGTGHQSRPHCAGLPAHGGDLQRPAGRGSGTGADGLRRPDSGRSAAGSPVPLSPGPGRVGGAQRPLSRLLGGAGACPAAAGV